MSWFERSLRCCVQTLTAGRGARLGLIRQLLSGKQGKDERRECGEQKGRRERKHERSFEGEEKFLRAGSRVKIFTATVARSFNSCDTRSLRFTLSALSLSLSFCSLHPSLLSSSLCLHLFLRFALFGSAPPIHHLLVLPSLSLP